MLVLSRKLQEAIVIGDGIRVTVVEIERGKVRLAIEADPDIPVYRSEVWERIAEDRRPEER